MSSYSIDKKTAIDIIDETLDNDQELDAPSIKMLAEWIKTDPHNADVVFQRFLLHVLLKDRFCQKSYAQLLESTGVLPGMEKLSAQIKSSKKTFWDKYRTIILSILFIAVVGGISVNFISSKDSSVLPVYVDPYFSKNLGFMKSSKDSAWNKDFNFPNSVQSAYGREFSLIQGTTSLSLTDCCDIIINGKSRFCPVEPNHINIDYGKFAFDNQSGESNLSIELPGIHLLAEKAVFCLLFDDQQQTKIFVLTGNIKVKSKSDVFLPIELSGINSSLLITPDGIDVLSFSTAMIDFGFIYSMLTNRCSMKNLTGVFAYDGFDYTANPSADFFSDTIIPIHDKNDGWGWLSPWRELGGVDSKVVYNKDAKLASDKRVMFSYTDSLGNVLSGNGGQLQTGFGPHSHCAREIDISRVPPSLCDDDMIGKDGSTLWLSFMAQSFDERSSNLRSAYLYLGKFNKGIMIGKSSLVDTGHWALETQVENDCRGFRIDNDYYSDRQTLFVVKIEFHSGHEQVSIWLNPPLSNTEELPQANLITSVPDFRFNEVGVHSRYSTDFDEIRLGTSFEAVTPVLAE